MNSLPSLRALQVFEAVGRFGGIVEAAKRLGISAGAVSQQMKLLEDTLDLAWMDTEQPVLATEPVLMASLWEALCQDICFESGWSPARLPCTLGQDCVVQVFADSPEEEQADD